MKSEMMYLVWATILAGLTWLPYVLDRIMVWGLKDALGYPESPKPQSPWAIRMKAAHANAIENLAVFSVLVLVANAAGISNSTTVLAASLYFWARLVHLLAYTFAIPLVRTLAFAGGFIAQAIFAWQLVVG
ncbi:MAG TPA: MAPEG family protein [Gallionella sp.]|nr:MAPEG family protein [Gallionella sp.]